MQFQQWLGRVRNSKAAEGHRDHRCPSSSQSPFLTFSFCSLSKHHFSIRVGFSIVQSQQAKWSILYMVLRWLFFHKALIWTIIQWFLNKAFFFQFCSSMFTWLYLHIIVLKQRIKLSSDCLFIKYASHGFNNHTRYTQSYTHTLFTEEKNAIQDACNA